MPEKASLEARINAEAIVKAACIQAAVQIVIAGQRVGPEHFTVEKTVAWCAMKIWEELEKPDKWPR
jgi:hypothetical protein